LCLIVIKLRVAMCFIDYFVMIAQVQGIWEICVPVPQVSLAV
jgi:hypothetical protein